MENENDFLCEKIINDIHGVFMKDADLSSFEIIPTTTDHKNKSPVIHIDHSLGLESWCSKLIYDYAHKYILSQKIKNRLLKNDSVVKYLNVALLINPDVTTFWHIRRLLIEKNKLKLLNKEFQFSALILTIKPKSNEAFAFRRWLFSFQSSESIDWQYEFGMCDRCADKSFGNYHAWTHRQWILQRTPNLLKSEIILTEKFIKKHISDYSCYYYRQFVLNKMFELNIYEKEQDLFFLKELINFYLKISVEKIDDIILILLPGVKLDKNRENFIKSFLYCCNLAAYDIQFCDEMKTLYRPKVFESLENHRRASLKFIVDNCVNLNRNSCSNSFQYVCSKQNQAFCEVTKFDYLNNKFLSSLKKSEGLLGTRHRKWCELFLGFDYSQ